METLNPDGKNSIKHKTQIMVHPTHQREEQRESMSAPATAGEQASPAPSPHEHGASSVGPPEYGQDTHRTPKAPQDTKRQGTFLLWHMDGLFSCWHLLNIHRRTALFLQGSSIKDVSPHVWNHGHTLHHLSRGSDYKHRTISHRK